jgi:hypothetical protein
LHQHVAEGHEGLLLVRIEPPRFRDVFHADQSNFKDEVTQDHRHLNLEVTCAYDHYVIEVIAESPDWAVLRCVGPLDLVIGTGSTTDR